MSSDLTEKILANAVNIDTVAKDRLVRPNQKHRDAIVNSEKNGLPAIAISALQGQYLKIQAQLVGAKTVLEVGTLGGYSTIWFAEAGAKATSIEIDPKHRDVALENIGGLDAEIILGAALDVMPKLAEEGRVFDMVFIDADWDEQYEYFDWAVKLTRKKGCIYVDNVVREMTQGDTKDKDMMKELLAAKIGKDKRVTATLIQTVSSHKTISEDMFDGFVLAIVD